MNEAGDGGNAETQERRRSWQRPAPINMLLRHGERDQTCAQLGLGVMPAI